MKVGLLLNSNNRLFPYSTKFKILLERNEIPFSLIDPNSITLLSDLKECTHLVFHHSQGDTDLKIYDTIYNIAHRIFGIKCMPDFDLCWQYEDKIKEYYLLKSSDFPTVDSRVFWNIEHADAFLEVAEYPLVAKVPKGAASSNVVLIKTPEEGKTINRQVFFQGVKAGKLNNKTNLFSFSKSGIFRYGKRSLRSFMIDTGILRDTTSYPEWQIQKDAILYQKYLPNNSSDQRIHIYR